MIESAKCRCGRWLAMLVDRNGALVERCYGCGHRAALRGRIVADRAVLVLEQMATTNPCGWPGGCDGFAAKGTDYCTAHCGERRRALGRAYQRLRSELGLRRRAS
jgi:hypothetical protein